jgi:hypothetical protein
MRKKETFLGAIFRSNEKKLSALAPDLHAGFINFAVKI